MGYAEALHARAVRGLDSTDRVFDGHTLGNGYRSVALLQSLMCQ